MKTRLQTPTTTRKMRRRAFRTRDEIYFRVLTDKRTLIDLLAQLDILPFQTTIYEAQNPEHWRGCTVIGFLRSFSREAMWALRKAKVVVLPIGHRSRYIAPRERDEKFMAMEPGEVGDILTVDDLGHPGWQPA